MDGSGKDDPDELLQSLCSKLTSATNQERKELLIQITELVELDQSASSSHNQTPNHPQNQISSHHQGNRGIYQPSSKYDKDQLGDSGASPKEQRGEGFVSSSKSPTPSLPAILKCCTFGKGYDLGIVLLRTVLKRLSELAEPPRLFGSDSLSCFQILVESLRSCLQPSKTSSSQSSPSTNTNPDQSRPSVSAMKCAAVALKAIHFLLRPSPSRLLLLQPQQVSDLVTLLLKAASAGLRLSTSSFASSSPSRSSPLSLKDSGRGRRLSSTSSSHVSAHFGAQSPAHSYESGTLGGGVGVVGRGVALGLADQPDARSSKSPPSPSKSQTRLKSPSSLNSRSSSASLADNQSETTGETERTIEAQVDAEELSSASEMEASQFSDTEGLIGRHESATDQGEAKREKRLSDACRGMRMNAIACIVCLNENSPNQVFPHWSSLFPDSSSWSSPTITSHSSSSTSRPSPFSAVPSPSASGSFSLFTLVESDPAISVRIAAAHALEVILAQGNQKGWLAAAEERSTRLASFTSLSARLGFIVVGLRTKIASFLSTSSRRSANLYHSRSSSSLSSSSLGVGNNRAANTFDNQPAALLEVVLRLGRTLVTATATAKLRQSHIQVLRQPVLELCSHPEPTVAVAAYSLLSALISTPSGGSNVVPGSNSSSNPDSIGKATAATATLALNSDAESSTSDADSQALQEILKQLQNEKTADAVCAQLWSTLAAFAGNRKDAFESYQENLLPMLKLCFPDKSENVRQAAASFLLSFLRSQAEQASSPSKGSSSSATSISPSSRQEDRQFQLLRQIINSAKIDSSPIVRTLLADCLPYWYIMLRSSPLTRTGDSDTRSILSLLMKDTEAAVRAAAVRALGVILTDSLKSDFKESSDEDGPSRSTESTLEYSLRSLVGSKASPPSTGSLDDEALLVQIRATWTLANLCEVYFTNQSQLIDSGISRSFCRMLLQPALASSKKEERVAINALRAFGALFASIKSDWLIPSKEVRDQERENLLEPSTEAMEKLCEVVWVDNPLQASPGSHQGGSPKLKWNAASSLGRALGSQEARKWMCKRELSRESLLWKVISALSSSLHSKTFKVKLASSHALLQLPTATWSDQTVVSLENLLLVKRSCDLALENIDDMIRNATFTEANLHGEPCRAALKKLKERLEESGF